MQYTGRTSDKEIAEAVRIAQSDERFDRLLYNIHDFRECEGLSFTQSEMEELAVTDAIAARTLRRHKMAVAVVTDRQDVRASVDAYIGSDFNLHDVRVFSSVADAHTWLSSEINA